MINWKEQKGILEKYIVNDKLSYVQIGKIYGCTGTNIKKRAKALGISLPERRKINPEEVFSKTIAVKRKCLRCGKETQHYNKYCSLECRINYVYEQKLCRWKSGCDSGLKGTQWVSNIIRRYLFDKYNNKCQICGWGEINKFTNRIPLQIHHIDGNCLNNSEENLQLLCPNCHSLTENFGSRNKNATRIDRRLR